MEIVKLRMQLQGEGGGPKLSAADTVKQLGLRGLYRGTAACWLRDVPFSFIFFPLFANLKTAFGGDESIVGLFTAGAMAGSLSAGMVTPCDVVKTRLQVVGGSDRYKGACHGAPRWMACMVEARVGRLRCCSPCQRWRDRSSASNMCAGITAAAWQASRGVHLKC